MNPSTLQRIGELYLATAYGKTPLTASQVAAHEKLKTELRQLCAGAVYTPWRSDVPDDEMTVMLCCPTADEPVWPGYLVNGVWHWADGTEVVGVVTGWQHLPEPMVAEKAEAAS